MKLSPIRFLGLIIGLVCSLNGFAQFNMASPLPIDPNVKVGRLPNGLTYYIRKNAKPEKKVELRLAVNAGAVLEDNDQRGLAHFMEHMNFNGSKHFPKNELVDYLQKIGVQFGADLNAYTGFDETVYILPIPAEDPKIVEQGFTVLEDWAGNNLLDKSEIEKERGVVLEESRLSKGANERMLRQYFPKLFNGSRYAERLPIGKDSILKTFKPETLARFYKQWYRPSLMAVVVVGDIDPAEAEKKIKEHFSHFTNPPAAKPRPSVIPIQARTKPEAMVLTDEEATNTVLEVFNFIKPAKKVKTWGDFREATVQQLINTLINNRLQELTQKENPPFVYGYTGTDQFIRGYDAFLSFAVLGNSTAQEAVNALVAETERARKYGFLATELDRAKANMLNQSEQAYKEKDKSLSGNMVMAYVNNFLEGQPIPGPENRYKFVKQVLPGITLKEINDAVKKLTPSTNAFALVTAPASMKDKLPSNSELLKELVAATKQPLKPYEEKAVAQNLMEGGLTAGKINSETKNDKLGTTNLTLSNGVTVTLKPTNFKNDEIQLDAWRQGGWQRFPLDQKDNAKHAAELVGQMGIKDMSPTDLDKFLSGKTVETQPYINDYEEGIQGSSSVKDFETFLQLINLYFTQPRKDQALFNSYVGKAKSQLQFIKGNPQAFYQDTLSKILYNGSPWIDAIPSAEEYANIDLDKSLGIYRQVFGNADGMHFTFVGNIDMDKVKPMLEKYLGSLPAQPAEHQSKDNGARPVKGIVNANIKKGKEAQSTITVIWTGETEYNRQDNLALRALIDVLNIRVIEKLREEMGGMYSGGLGGGVQKRPYTHYTVQARIPCGPENVDKLTAALFDIIKNAQDGKIEQKDLDKVKETLKQHYRTHLQDNETWLSTLSQAFIDQENPEVFLDYEKRVDALTTADLQKAAQKFLNMNNYVRAVLYPENANVQGGVQKTF
jgi:zinc protease